MNRSTIAMMCSYSGYLEDVPPYAVVDVDWSNALEAWSAATPMDTEERLLVQAGMLKLGGGGGGGGGGASAAPPPLVMIYRNTVYGYPWMTSVRFILDDDAYRPWFLTFSGSPPYFSPPCDDNYSPPKCTDLFHTQMDTPNIAGKNGYGTCAPPACNCGSKPCGFFVFNHSSDVVVHGQTFREWFISSYVLNAAGLSPSVDGFFFDDYWSELGDFGDNTPNMTIDMGLSPADLVRLTAAYRANMAELANRTLAARRFAWTMFWNGATHSNGNAEFTPLVAKETCAADLRLLCSAASPVQSRAALFGLSEPSPTFGGPSLRNDLANFLLVRGPYAFFGTGWLECSRDWAFPSALNVDVGTPAAAFSAGLCAETAPGSGVFVRNFTGAVVTTDCNKWESSVCPRDGGPCLGSFSAASTFLVKLSESQWDHAFCANTGRECTVYTDEYSYVREFAEGACITPGWEGAALRDEPTVSLSDYWYAGGVDNMVAVTGAPPANGKPWQDIDLECFAYVNAGPGRWPLEVWWSVARNDFWTLSSPASRANATAENYTLYSHIGYVLAVDESGSKVARRASGAPWS